MKANPDRLTNAQGRDLLNKTAKKKPVANWGKQPQIQPIQTGAILIGIDPGSVVTGFALLIENEPPKLLGFKSHCEAILYALQVVQTYGRKNIHFVVEDARKVVKNAWFAKQNGGKKDQGAGYVKALSKDWECFCRDIAKVPYTLQAPNPAITKWLPERFEALTGIKTLKGEHHLRDAYLLINYALAA